jgi:SAM-dependent methyltransferase
MKTADLGSQDYDAAKPYIGYETRIDWPTPGLAALISILPAGRALDIGCGHGTESIFLGSFGWTVLGFDQAVDSYQAVDDDDRPIQAARARLKLTAPTTQNNVRFKKATLHDFRLTHAGKYDLVIDRLVYNTWLDSDTRDNRRKRHAVLNLAAKALRPGGLFLLRFRDTDASQWGIIKKRLIPPGDRKILESYFVPANEGRTFTPIGFSAMVSPIDAPTRALTIERRTLSLMLLRRNAKGVSPRGEHR